MYIVAYEPTLRRTFKSLLLHLKVVSMNYYTVTHI